MKNKEVMSFFIISLLLITPVAYADNFLSGYSILDKFNNFLSSASNFFKGIFSKETRGQQLLCNNGAERTEECNTNLPGICSVGTRTLTCKEREWVSEPCAPNIQVGEQQETSNEMDDDCDGQVDESEYTLTIDYIFPGRRNEGVWVSDAGTVTANDIGYTEPIRYDTGAQVILTANANSNYKFNKWRGTGITEDQKETNPLTITMDNDKTISVFFQKIYKLTTGTYPQNTGKIKANDQEYTTSIEYNSGTSVTLEATANPSYRFTEWVGRDIEGLESNNPLTITMNEDKNIIANFQSIPCGNNRLDAGELCDKVNNVDQFQQGKTCASETQNKPYGSLKCNDDCTINSLSCTEKLQCPNGNSDCISLDAECSEPVCNFGWCDSSPVQYGQTDEICTSPKLCDGSGHCIYQKLYELTISTNPQNIGTIDKNPQPAQGKYTSGTEVTLTAISPPDYTFTGWRINGEEVHSNPIKIIINGNKDITANFQKIIENCEDSIDNDNDGLIDNLDSDCAGEKEGLKIKAIRASKSSLYSNSKINIENDYEIIERTPEEVIQCMNITLDNIDLNCQQKTSQQNLIRYVGCNTGGAGLNKKIEISTIPKCNTNQNFKSNFTYINVTEFTTCSDGIISKESIDNLEITEPSNDEEFEEGETINIKTKVSNNYINEDGDEEDIDVTVVASLVDAEEWDEIETSSPAEKRVDYSEEETFNLNFTVPQNLDNNDYMLYVKAFKSRDEDVVCNSKGIALSIQESGGNDCSTDSDNDGFCSDEDCNDNNPSINSEAMEICTDAIDNNCDGLTDYADSSCQLIPGQGQGNQQGGEPNIGGEDMTDSDNDGLPDYWEYNYFGNLLQGPNDDPDNDGINNINEYIGNTNPKIPDKKKSSLIWEILLIILGIGIIILIAVVVIKKLRKKPQIFSNNFQNYSLSQNNQSKLQSFIQQAKSQGMNKQQIKITLLNAGWKEQDIDRFL